MSVPCLFRVCLLGSLTLVACREEREPPGTSTITVPASASMQATAAVSVASNPPPTPPSRERPGCSIETTGHQQTAWSTRWTPPRRGEPHPTHARSTYWASEQEVAVARSRNIDVPLEITCAGTPNRGLGGAVSAISRSSKPEHVPLSPASYPLVAGGKNSQAKPGEFAVGVLLVGHDVYRPTSGTLKLTRFDETGVSGSFDLNGELPSDRRSQIRVHGKFEIPCGDVAQSKCRR